MITLEVNENGLVMTDQGDLSILSDLDALVQKITRKLKLWKGEYFLDTSAGIPYKEQIFDRPIDAGIASTIITSQITDETEVTEVTNITIDLDPSTRKFSYSATVKTIYGETEVSI